MAYPNYGYAYNYGPGYLGNQPQYPSVNSQYMTNPYQNIQPPQPTQAVPNTIIPPTTNAAVNEPDTASQKQSTSVHKSTVPTKSADSSAN